MYAMSYIYAGLDSCRSLSFTEDGTNYDKFTITSNQTIQDALTYWIAQANASSVLSLTDYAFSINTSTGAITISAGGAFKLKFHGNLDALLGFEPAVTKVLDVPSGSTTSTASAKGVLIASAGFEAPKPMESARIERLRHGRSNAFIHNHGRFVRVWFYMSRADFDSYDVGPIFSGKFRLYHTANVSEYSSSNTDGYLDLYPFSRPTLLARGRDESFVRLEIDCMLDDNYATPVPSAPSYAAIGASLPFGWSVCYGLRVEGITALFTEADLAGTAPTNTTQRTALVIDGSAKIGSVADRNRGLGKAFDLTVGLIDTDPTDGTAVRDFFDKPTAFCSLTSDLAYNATTIAVDDSSDFESSSVLWVGNEAINYTGKTATSFTGCTRSYAGNKAYNHSIKSDVSVWVSNKPFSWLGREVWLYAIPMDPFGDIPHDITVAGANITASAPVVFRGNVASQPMRVDEKWSFTCRPIVRTLSNELIAAPTGQAVWALDDDLKVKVDLNFTWVSHYQAKISGSYHKATFSSQPFANLSASSFYTLKQLRQYLALQLTSLFSDASDYPTAACPRLSAFSWVDSIEADEVAGSVTKKSQLRCTVTSHSDDLEELYVMPFGLAWDATPLSSELPWISYADEFGNVIVKWVNNVAPEGPGVLSGQVSPMPDDGETAAMMLAPVATANCNTGFLKVSVDDGIAADLPTDGFVVLEADGGNAVYRYDSVAENGDGTISIGLVNAGLDIPKITESVIKGDASTMPVRFAFHDEGLQRDMMLRMIMSSGKAGVNHATYDSESLEQGYDIAHVNADSFAEVLDGPLWAGTGGHMLYESGDGFSLYGGILALGQRCVVENERDGDVKIEMVHTSFADSGVYSQTIKNHHLVTNKAGREPIRPKQVLENPNFIQAKVVSSDGARDGTIVARDVQKMRQQGTIEMGLTIKGMTRSHLAHIFYDLAYSWFAVGNGRPQAVEIDIHPSVDVQVGDAVKLQLQTHHLYQYGTALSHRGYDGFARVAGRQIDLNTGVQTLTLMLDGVLKSLALSPSAKVLAFAGAGSAATEISIDKKYQKVMSLFLDGESSFKLIAYKPGQDGTSYAYNVSAVTLDGDHTKLTIASQVGTFTVAAGWYLTNAVTADANTNQGYFAHTDTDGVWI